MKSEMICPYCSKAMEKGIIYNGVKKMPFWCEEGRKRSVGEALLSRGVLPTDKAGKTAAFYCSDCEKIIIDAKLDLFD